MNIKKSINLALVHHEKTNKWLASEMGVSVERIRAIKNSTNINQSNIEKLAKCFGMSASEFIALGE